MTNQNYTNYSNKELLDIVLSFNVPYSHLSRFLKKYHQDILLELLNRTKFLDTTYPDKNIPIMARLYCLEYNLKEQPKCEAKGCNNYTKWNCSSKRFKRYCCHECYKTDPNVIIRREQTNLSRIGVKYPTMLKSFWDEVHKTNLKKFGHQNVASNEQVKEKIRNTNRERHGVDYYVQSNEFKEKSKQTCLKNWGTEQVMSSQKFKNIIKQYWKNNFGVEYNTQVPETKNKIISTFKKKFGKIENPQGNKKLNDKRKQKCKELYNAEHYCKSNDFRSRLQEIQTKQKETFQSHYGYDWYLQTPEFQHTRGYKYVNEKYPQMAFASSWEFKVYDFLKEHKIDFEYQCKPIQYEYDGKIHYYHPDFKVNNKLYEVKGDHFFRINEFTGKEEMFCPYRRPEWTNEQYEYVCGLFNAKYKCMISNNVIILRHSHIKTLSLDLFQ